MPAQRAQDVYLQVRRRRDTYGRTRWTEGMTIVSCSPKPPTTRSEGSVLVKIRLIVPDEAFDPAAIPALVAEIPLEMLHPPQDEIVVDVLDANP